MTGGLRWNAAPDGGGCGEQLSSADLASALIGAYCSTSSGCHPRRPGRQRNRRLRHRLVAAERVQCASSHHPGDPPVLTPDDLGQRAFCH